MTILFTPEGPDGPAMPLPRRWYALLGPAALRHAWDAIDRALDTSQGDIASSAEAGELTVTTDTGHVLESFNTPLHVFGFASSLFQGGSLGNDVLCFWAHELWSQRARRQ